MNVGCQKREMGNLSEHTKESLISELRSLADRLQKKSISRAEFIRETGISEWHVQRHFDSWNQFVTEAGLQPTDVSRIPDQELMEAMYQAYVAERGITTRLRFRKVAKYSEWVYTRRWGKWENVLLEFRHWAEISHPDFPYFDQLPTPPTDRPVLPENASSEEAPELAVWTPKGGRLYGPILNFRGLQHAPINEQGVVFLFGMVAFALGFVVESVATGFPDCEAKRRVDRGGNKWERVRIEFEYQSRTFREHGHDPTQCDIIICWEDNWPESPVEVLELKSAIEALDQE